VKILFEAIICSNFVDKMKKIFRSEVSEESKIPYGIKKKIRKVHLQTLAHILLTNCFLITIMLCKLIASFEYQISWKRNEKN
jgi:hypothetical protein